MFGEKKQDTIESGADKAIKKAIYSVHTMADDLSSESNAVVSPIKPQRNLTDNTSSSPFFSQKNKSENKQPLQFQMNKSNVIIGNAGNAKKEIVNKKKSGKSDANISIKSKNGLFFIISFLLLVSLLFGFLMWTGILDDFLSDYSKDSTKNSNSNIDIIEDVDNTLTDRGFNMLSKTSANIIISDQFVASDVFLAINSIIKEESPIEPVKIEIKSDRGDVVTFALFAKRFLTGLPDELLVDLDEPFSIWIFPQGNEYRIGIYAKSKNPDATRKVFRETELVLQDALRPLYLFDTNNIQADAFSDSVYRDIPIRFVNFTPDTHKSLDYVTHYEHVLIGTSRASMHTMIDTLLYDSVKNENIEELSLSGNKDNATIGQADKAITTSTPATIRGIGSNKDDVQHENKRIPGQDSGVKIKMEDGLDKYIDLKTGEPL